MREESIFASALELLDPAERAAYLDDACAGDRELRIRVEALLRAHQQSGDLLDPPDGGLAHSTHHDVTPVSGLVAAALAARAIAEGPGTRIGPYKLLQSIGEGGMGVVFMAEQETPVRRKVALKVIKPGMDSALVVARFEAERQALALMDHNNIAKVLDAGTTESGRPFFVMELVNGVPITEYSDRNSLTTRQRLALFVPVCQAIQHAHQKGIIHRDIKPSNVLVAVHDDAAVPKVIDFGVAKAIEQRLTERTLFTQFGVILGTPEYMSPEQSQMSGLDIDTRSDIYSLGVLLYELLTGTTPLEREGLREAAFAEVMRRIREEEPPRPSTRLQTTEHTNSIAEQRGTDATKLARGLRGDLDWIVMKALEKDRTRRYESAGGFARDIQRHLDGDPVEAGPPSAVYRLGRFARKHRVALATAIAFVTILAQAALISTWQAVRARRAEATSNANLEKAKEGEARAKQSDAESKAVVDFFRDKILAAARPAGQDGGLGRSVSMRDALDHAESSIAGRFTRQPTVEARIRDALGQTYNYFGEPALAIAQYERSRALFEATLGPEHHDTLVAMSGVAGAHKQAGRLKEAIPLFEKTLVLMDRTLGPGHLHTLAVRNNLAGAYLEAGRIDEAVTIHEQVTDAMQAKAGLEHVDTLSSMNNLANAYRRAGRPADALALHEKTLTLMKATLPATHPNLLNCMSNLALDYSNAGRLNEAISLDEEALELKQTNPGPEHPDTLRTMGKLAGAYRSAGRTALAISLFEKGLKIAKAKLDADHPVTLYFMHSLGQTYVVLERTGDAIPLLEELVKRSKSALPPDHPDLIARMSDLGVAYRQAGRIADAIPVQEATLKLARTKLGLDNPQTLNFMNKLVMSYLDLKRFADAETISRECLKLYEAKQPDDWARFLMMGQLGAALAGEKHYAEAEPLLIDSYEGMKARESKIPPSSKKELGSTKGRIVAFYEGWGKAGKAAEWRSK